MFDTPIHRAPEPLGASSAISGLLASPRIQFFAIVVNERYFPSQSGKM
jgi:hypothetical protein